MKIVPGCDKTDHIEAIFGVRSFQTEAVLVMSYEFQSGFSGSSHNAYDYCYGVASLSSYFVFLLL